MGGPAYKQVICTRAAPSQHVLHFACHSPQPSVAAGGSGHSTAANGSAAAADGSSNGSSGEPAYSLFAFPAYDNFSGKISPAEWVKAVQAKSTPEHQWKVRGGGGKGRGRRLQRARQQCADCVLAVWAVALMGHRGTG